MIRVCVCLCARARMCACNPGLCENVITCMSKCASVYVSKMAPVLNKGGLPADTQLQMSAARLMCV